MDEMKLQAESPDVQAEFEKLRFQLKAQEMALQLACWAIADEAPPKADVMGPGEFYAVAVKKLAAQGVTL